MADQVSTVAPPLSSAAVGKPTSARQAVSTDASPLSKADLQLWIQFDLGALQFSLPEIEQFVPGQTFLLNRTPDRPVHLKCCGQTIAEARLVQVNGQLAVQVARLRPRHEGANHE